MRFPSDDELMAGPNALEGVTFDEAEAAELTDDADIKDEDFGDADFDDADFGDDDDVEESFARLTDVKALRSEANAAAGLVAPDFPEDFRAGVIAIVGRPNVAASCTAITRNSSSSILPGTTGRALC